ncbi:MAG: FAD-binding protein, partial [Polyangiaceae bacterium]|nr:FAD-binding protein [Polyangiaceae bacterium]
GGGGATTISGGVVYLGGGSRIQREAGVEDSVEDMYRYLKLEVQDVVSDETLRDFCEQSIANHEWLERHGVPFEASLCPVKTSYPTDDYYLYYSGNESFSPYKEEARPAPRGHRAKGKSLPGASFYEPLRASVLRSGADVQYHSRAERLITDAEGNVVGVEYYRIPDGIWSRAAHALMQTATAIRNYNPKAAAACYARVHEIERTRAVVRTARARHGVIIASGGFIYNREMVKEHAPAYRRGMPLGTIADNGSGIKLGESVGGALGRMGRISAWRFINPPEAFTRGIVVNGKGERYVNEMLYGAAIGEAMVDRNDGVALLIIDKGLKAEAREQCKPGKAQWFQRAPALLNLWFNAREAKSVEELAKSLKIDPAALRKTFDEYNRGVDAGVDAFGKPKSQLRRLDKGPFYAINCSIDSKRFPCPTLTLGGLIVDELTGQVKREDGSRIGGLYAAGRSAVGICSRQYVSGLSIADCVYSGRRAGRTAASASGRGAEAAE